MLKVVQNVYIHEYFTANNLMTSDLKLETESNIEKGMCACIGEGQRTGLNKLHM